MSLYYGIHSNQKNNIKIINGFTVLATRPFEIILGLFEVRLFYKARYLALKRYTGNFALLNLGNVKARVSLE